MQRVVTAAVVALVLLVVASPARADFVFWLIEHEGDLAAMVFEGRATVTAGIVIYVHPRFGKIHMKERDCIVIKTEPVQSRLNRQMLIALDEKNSKELLNLGRQALKYGFVNAFYRAAEAILEFEPKNERAQLILKVRERTARPIPRSEKLAQEFREQIPQSKMKFVESPHFLVLHDLKGRSTEVRDVNARRKLKTRIEERIDLMEKVYEAFYAFFASHGVELNVPKQRMKVALFDEHADFAEVAREIEPLAYRFIDGFWSKQSNISHFYEHGSAPEYQALQRFARFLRTAAEIAVQTRDPARAEIMQFAKSLDLMIDIKQENEDVKVLTHELAHQIAANSGLLPRDKPVPQWVHEGLATYFESANEASWAGIGAVDEDRLEMFRTATNKRSLSHVNNIASNGIFTKSETVGQAVRAYGLSWALTYYLMEKDFDRLMRFYAMLEVLPPGLRLADDAMYRRIFDEAFPPSERAAMDREFHAYMNNLQTDTEVIIGQKLEKELKKKLARIRAQNMRRGFR